MPNRLVRVLAATLLALPTLLLPAAAQEASTAPALGRGVNILGYDPIWTDPAQARFQPRHMQAIARAGFDHVRLNLHAFAHMDAQGRLSPAWLAQLQRILRLALDNGLQVIVDEHDFIECAKDTAACRTRLAAFWEQVAPLLKDAPDTVLFEILNEPNGATNAVWPQLLAENLQIIRRSNPTRRVIVGPDTWNSMRRLEQLQLPEQDRHLIVTFHYYDPFPFTHQGAPWEPKMKDVSGVTWGSAEELRQLQQDMRTVRDWAERHRRPVLLGEFGTLETAGLEPRARWSAAVARAAEAQGFGWTYWQFDGNFVLWDTQADAWVQPMLKALMTPRQAAAVRKTDPALDFLVDAPSIERWQVYGDPQTHQPVDCATKEKRCLRVALPARRPQPWDIGALQPIQAAIRKGDRLTVLLYARLDSDDPRAQAEMPVLIQMATPPYSAIAQQTVVLSHKLQPIVLNGQADADYAAGALQFSAQLGQLGAPLLLSAPYVLKNYKPSAN